MSQPKKLINVGIDFGTSGSKVIFRDVIGKKAWLCSFDHRMKDYPDFVLPSSVRIHEGKLYFGGTAEKLRKGIGIRSFKICMACSVGQIDKRDCKFRFHPLFHPEPGQFVLPVDGGESIDVSPCEIGSLYLAYLIRHVMEKIRTIFEDRELNITLNMSVPVDFLEEGKTRSVFMAALFIATQMVNVVDDGCLIKDVHEAYKKASLRTMPSEEEGYAFVQPETIVAVFSYVLSPLSEAGLYGIVDVGAGTSDVSFFRLSKHVTDKLAIYNARTHTIGANDIDFSIFEWLTERKAVSDGISDREKSDMVQRLRLLKQRIQERGPQEIRTKQGIYELSLTEFEKLSSSVAKGIFDKYRNTWSGAYQKEKGQSRWETYKLFLIGGGVRISAIRKEISSRPHDQLVKNVEVLELSPPSDLENVGQLDGNYHLLAIAYGLSFHPAMYPDIIFPSGVKPWRPELPDKDLPEWWEYWEQV